MRPFLFGILVFLAIVGRRHSVDCATGQRCGL